MCSDMVHMWEKLRKVTTLSNPLKRWVTARQLSTYFLKDVKSFTFTAQVKLELYMNMTLR